MTRALHAPSLLVLLCATSIAAAQAAAPLPGVVIDVGQTRDYLHGPELAHVIGYVAQVSEAEQGDDPLLALPGFRVGKAGVEKVYDEALRGRAGSSQVEVNAVGRVIRELKRTGRWPPSRFANCRPPGAVHMWFIPANLLSL